MKRAKRIDPDQLRKDLIEALCIGPTNDLNRRLDEVFMKHFGVKFKEEKKKS